MLASGEPQVLSLAEMVALRVHQYTHGRIRNLVVKETRGCVIVSGQVPTRHTKQLALHGALELISSEQFTERITLI